MRSIFGEGVSRDFEIYPLPDALRASTLPQGEGGYSVL
jgi:hypothetical protein